MGIWALGVNLKFWLMPSANLRMWMSSVECQAKFLNVGVDQILEMFC